MNLLARRHDATDVEVAEIARGLAVDAIDDTLRRLAGRERFGAAEAARIVAGVRGQVDEVVLGHEVTAVLDDVTATTERDTLVDAGRLADALLDLRNAVRP